MKEHEKIKEIVYQAVQATKSENSGLVSDITKKVTDAVREQVILTVNGKIDKIKEHLENQDGEMKMMGNKIDTLVENTKEVIETYNQSKGFFTVLKRVAMFVIPMGGAWAIISKVWK